MIFFKKDYQESFWQQVGNNNQLMFPLLFPLYYISIQIDSLIIMESLEFEN